MKIQGQMKVKTLKAQFADEFGLTLRVYSGPGFADDDATLATVRKNGAKGGEFTPRINTKVGNLEDRFLENFGIKIQVAGSDDSYLCENDLTLQAARDKDAKKVSKKAQRALSVGAAASGDNDAAEDAETPEGDPAAVEASANDPATSKAILEFQGRRSTSRPPAEDRWVRPSRGDGAAWAAGWGTGVTRRGWVTTIADGSLPALTDRPSWSAAGTVQVWSEVVRRCDRGAPYSQWIGFRVGGGGDLSPGRVAPG